MLQTQQQELGDIKKSLLSLVEEKRNSTREEGEDNQVLEIERQQIIEGMQFKKEVMQMVRLMKVQEAD